MSESKLGKPSLYYSFLFWSVYLFYRLYYRSLVVVGRANVPANKPVIFASNHQNALMDALTILFANRGRVVYMTRADLFKKKWLNLLLRSFRMLPVFRIRDGISSMGQNDQTFTEATDILRQGTPIGIFPEGNHAGFKRLRPLKKGICRIAFMAEESAGYNLDLHIVPAGIDYSNYSGPGTRVMVRYGAPIRIADFIPQYKENPQRALGELRDVLSDALKPLIINITSEENYDAYIHICELYGPHVLAARNLKVNHQNRFEVEQEIIAGLDKNIAAGSAFGPIVSTIAEYRIQLKKHRLDDRLLRKEKTSLPATLVDAFISLIFLPIFLYGLGLNYLPYKLPERFTRKIEDQVFHESIHFGIRMVLFPIYHLALLFIFSLFFKGLLIRFLFVLSLPLSGMFTFYYYKHLLWLQAKFRFLRFKKTDHTVFQNLQAKRMQLINQISNFLNVS